jgi:ureidoacrylate peracid hydrolase
LPRSPPIVSRRSHAANHLLSIRETLIIGGYSTNFCCDSTARDANFRDYSVIVLEEARRRSPWKKRPAKAISAEPVQKTVLANLRRGFAQVATVEEVTRAIAGD